MDMTKIAKHNNGDHYILLAINIFYFCVWMVPLRDKSVNEVVCALSKIYQEKISDTVHSDKGTEFLEHKVYSNHT